MRQQHTPGPWQWWTSNSLRRLTSHAGGRSGQDGGVLHAYRCRDGVADVAVNEADMALIAAAPDLRYYGANATSAAKPGWLR